MLICSRDTLRVVPSWEPNISFRKAQSFGGLSALLVGSSRVRLQVITDLQLLPDVEKSGVSSVTW